MKKILAALSLAACLAYAEPVSCNFLEEGRAVAQPGCKCTVHQETLADTIKVRTVLGSCGGGKYSSEVLDMWLNGHWAKVSYTMCERLSSVKKYSCKQFNYLMDDYENNAKYITETFSEHYERLRPISDKGDVEYLFGE